MLGCLLPLIAAESQRVSAARSRDRLREIGLAIIQYHDTYHMLPPAVVTDGQGRPLYSWRVLVLPFLEEKALYDRFRLDEPWDSPHNRALLEGPTPAAYRSDPADRGRGGLTHYQVFVGPNTPLERPGLRLPDDFPDGMFQTLLVVEGAEPVPWPKPADLAYAPNQPLPRLGGLHPRPLLGLGYLVGGEAGFNACFMDGSVRFLPNDIDERTLRAAIVRHPF
jgi:hypothetical protein